MSLHYVIVFLSTLAAQPPAGNPAELTFVESTTTLKHIAIQPRRDHHRIHFLLRARGLDDRRLYASVHCYLPDAEEPANKKSVHTVFFTPTTDNQLFAVYLRTPKFAHDTAEYQVHLGEHIPDRPDLCVGGFRPMNGFTWRVTRSTGGATFHPLEDENPLPVDLQYSIAKIVGGEIHVESRVRAIRAMLKFGVDRTHDQADIDGTWIVRVLNAQ